MTSEERQAIADLQALAKRWPKTLWIYATGSELNIMQVRPDGRRAVRSSGNGDGVDPTYRVATVNIPNDGGDW